MNNPAEIRNIALLRLDEAQCLFANGKFDGAYYLAGYALELTFKAKICECLNVDDFFKRHVPNSALSSVYLSHNLDRLLLLSGLYTHYENDKLTNSQLMNAWSCVVKWNEKTRYQLPNTYSNCDAQDLITSVNTLIQWIRTH
ncbi:HEPN domain-containing protein [Sphingobacteriales bacterium UPWRP_1]|nr:hypothetical protein B6N25_06650 [Sphingobacteriales bacterium TSM_CSS]PSJ71668.1 HEPN domain-containing protein [Sphingobacteriales bacterium UPWRP_1]